MKRRRQAHDKGPNDKPESSSGRGVDTEDRSNASVHEDDPVLEPKHRIFLSHSGKQKNFAERLCGDLEKLHRFPFYDRRHESLPRGERFPELILRAARQCEIAVVVLSENFLTSKWPMIELNTFVQTWLKQKKSKSSELKILPLFYKLSVSELGDEDRRKGWFGRWVELAKEDPRIDVEAWKRSLKELGSFNGIGYSREPGTEKAYRVEVVGHICKAVPACVKWDDSHVRGGSRLCQVIQDHMNNIQLSKQYNVCIVGIYGLGGIGKTTACKVLCNGLSEEFQGKVSHVDVGQNTFIGVVKNVLNDLVDTNQELYQQLDDEKCWNILRNDMRKQKTFLVIDNVWPTSKSIGEAQKYLQAGFHKESVVMVTSRALETLTRLGVSESSCLEVPSLDKEDATSLFLHHAAFGIQFPEDDDKRAIEKCVARCYFRKGNWEDGQYLPLALKALGLQLIGKRPSEWEWALPKEKGFNSGEREDAVFSILRSSFDDLQFIHQCLFMDVALHSIYYAFFPKKCLGVTKWLSLLYKKDVEEIGSMLQHLRGRGLVEDVNMVLERVEIHDLYREFAELEARGKVIESDFEKRRWVLYIDNHEDLGELEATPPNGCWTNLIRLDIRFRSEIYNLQVFELGYLSNVKTLQLSQARIRGGKLDARGLKCLRSLEIFDVDGLKIVDGLQDLNNLAYFRWVAYGADVSSRMVGQLPASLQVLQLELGNLECKPDWFTRCTNLITLEAKIFKGGNLDFSACAALQSVELVKYVGCYETGIILDFNGCSSLRSVNLENFMYVENEDFSGGISQQSLGVRFLNIAGTVDFTGCSSLRTVKLAHVDCVAGLIAKSEYNLRFRSVYGCPGLAEIPGLGQVVGLQHLKLHAIPEIRKLPCLQRITRL